MKRLLIALMVLITVASFAVDFTIDTGGTISTKTVDLSVPTSGIPTRFEDLSNGEILTWNAAISAFVNSSPGAASAFPLSDLTDVNFTSLTDGDTIVRQSGSWVNVPLPTMVSTATITSAIGDNASAIASAVTDIGILYGADVVVGNAIASHVTDIGLLYSDVASNVVDIGILYSSGGDSLWTENDTGVISASAPVSIEGDTTVSGVVNVSNSLSDWLIKFTSFANTGIRKQGGRVIFGRDSGPQFFIEGTGLEIGLYRDVKVYGYLQSDGAIMAGTTTNDGVNKLQVVGGGKIDVLRVGSTAPATAASTGVAGTVTYDADFIYVCVSTDTWKRAALSTW